MEKTDVMVGTFTPFSTEISKETLLVFNTAFKDFVGVDYIPLAVATQIVAGTNYRFFCNAKETYPGALNKAAMIEIFQPLNGIPTIREIRRC